MSKLLNTSGLPNQRKVLYRNDFVRDGGDPRWGQEGIRWTSETDEGRAVVGVFDGGLTSSDVGALLPGTTNNVIRLVERFATCFTVTTTIVMAVLTQ